MQDGVLVVDSNGLVRQHNPQVAAPARAAGARARSDRGVLGRARPGARATGARATGRATPVLTLPETGNGGARALRRRRRRERQLHGDLPRGHLASCEDQAHQLKLAALGRLTANIAHEIRNPLAAISHASRADERGEPAARARAPDRASSATTQGGSTGMVKDVLELNRRDRVQPEAIRLTPFLGTFLDEFAQNEQVDREGFVLELDGDGVVEFDRVHLHQVLWNLVRNGWRHSRKGAGSVRLRLLRQGNRLELHVIDDGPGVREGPAEPVVRAVLHHLQRRHRPRPVHRARAVRGERRRARLRRPRARAAISGSLGRGYGG